MVNIHIKNASAENVPTKMPKTTDTWYPPIYIYISSHSDAIVELFSYRKGADFFMKCLFAEVHQFYLSTKRLTKITVAFKYYCIIEFVYLQTVIIYIYVMYVRLPQV